MTVASPVSQHQRFFDTLGKSHNAEADGPPLTEPPDFERIAPSAKRAASTSYRPPKPTRDRIDTSLEALTLILDCRTASGSTSPRSAG
jgi:hypothetical protein